MSRVFLKWFSAIVISFFSISGFSQCILPSFEVDSYSCQSNNITFNFNFVPAGNELYYSWDFCDGSLLATPQILKNTILSDLSGAFDVALFEEDGVSYALVANAGNNTIIRMAFVDGFENNPQVSLVTNTISVPKGVAVYEKSGKKYGVVAGDNGNVYLMDFGDSFTNSPAISTITDGLNDIRHVRVIEADSRIYILLPSNTPSGSGVLSVLDMGNAITNAVQTKVVWSLSGTGYLTGIDVIRECGQWYALLSGYSSGLHLLSFGTNILSEPSIQTISGVNQLLGLNLHTSNGHKYLFVATSLGTTNSILRLDFGESINNAAPAIENIGDLGTLNLAIAFTIMPIGSKYYGIAFGYSDNAVTVLDFPKPCDLMDNFRNTQNPEITFEEVDESSTFNVSLKVLSQEGALQVVTRTIAIADYLPESDFLYEGVCMGFTTIFTPSHQADGSIFVWDFGDGSQQTASTPLSKIYAGSGSYTVSLGVTADNGCHNYASKEIKIYSQPDPDFTLPSSSICTNSEVLIANNTEDVYEGLLSYDWFINGELESHSRDLHYVFYETGSSTIKLITSIPGCTSELVKLTTEIQEGPELSLAFEGQCENETILFSSSASQPVVAYEWSFGDGNSSSEENPEHVFNNDGDFQVSLTAITESGCNSVVTENMTVHPQPNPDFTIELQPVYCTNISLNFTGSTPDTDDPIQLATWNFNDGSAPSSGMVIDHQFEKAGTYDVSFETTTQPGCSNTVVKQIVVYPTPGIEFVSTPACVGVPVDFSATTTGTINTWQWQISDKSYSNDQPTHIFRTPGAYAASVTVTDINGCAASLSEVVSVPDPLDPDFAVLKNCVNENAVLTDITDQGDDPIASWTWQVDEESALTGNPLVFVFSKAEEVPVTLSVVTESGCSYFVSKDIEVVPFPEASFTMSSEIGSPPFLVNFTNHSEDASDYAWDFDDGNISNEASPAHEYTEVGEFTITLTASNPEGCEHSSTKEISISPAQPDIRIMAVTATENPDKTVGVMVILHNDGNTIIYDLPLDIDISGTVQVREIIEGPVLPRSRVNFSLGYGVRLTDDISFLCATATLAGDVEPETNRNCIEFSSEVVFLPGYPNPAKEFLQIEWVAPQEETVRASLRNLLGNEIWTLQFSSEKGLNQKTIEVQNLQKGIYMLILESPRVTTMQRILIAR